MRLEFIVGRGRSHVEHFSITWDWWYRKIEIAGGQNVQMKRDRVQELEFIVGEYNVEPDRGWPRYNKRISIYGLLFPESKKRKAFRTLTDKKDEPIVDEKTWQRIARPLERK